MVHSRTFYVSGSLINPKSLGLIEFIESAILKVVDGLIVQREVYSTPKELSVAIENIKKIDPSTTMLEITQGSFLTPGFVDLHTHAPQFRNRALGMQFELLEWLDRVTFPEEKRFNCDLKPNSDHESSNCLTEDDVFKIYREMTRHYLMNGTTTCVYFGSLHLRPNQILAECLNDAGQRALVGKVCMDCNSPTDYVETFQESLTNTKAFCEYVRSLGSTLINPVITPRFAITCSRECLKGLGDLYREENLDPKNKVYIQTHLSETRAEVDFVTSLFPESKSYSHVYDEAGLLTPRTILAHCIYLENLEIDLIKERNCGIAHCPTSNFSLSSGVLDVRRLLDAGIQKIGLGSDISGGYAVCILDAIRSSLFASKLTSNVFPANENYKQNGKSLGNKAISPNEAFFLATLGGATALGMEDSIGSLDVGKRFDALFIHPTKSLTSGEKIEESFYRFLFTGDDRWITHVFVDGKPIVIK